KAFASATVGALPAAGFATVCLAGTAKSTAGSSTAPAKRRRLVFIHHSCFSQKTALFWIEFGAHRAGGASPPPTARRDEETETKDPRAAGGGGVAPARLPLTRSFQFFRRRSSR